MVEFEKSYVFDLKVGLSLKKRLGDDAPGTPIHDSYLSPDVRIRKLGERYFLTSKTGSKASGKREEKEIIITNDVADSLRPLSKLNVLKERFSWKVDEYQVSLDYIYSPMELAVLEVESNTHEVPDCVAPSICKVNALWKTCPLSAFKFFKRKIGICGGPSSGKTETAKRLSHELNTVYKANAFHVTEFATTFIQRYGRYPEAHDALIVFDGQASREKSADKANIVISDCPTFTAYIYLLYNNIIKPLPKEDALLIPKVYKKAIFDSQTYSDIILLRIKEYVENNIRYQTPEEARQIECRIESFLRDHGIPYIDTNYTDKDLIKKLFYINEATWL